MEEIIIIPNKIEVLSDALRGKQKQLVFHNYMNYASVSPSDKKFLKKQIVSEMRLKFYKIIYHSEYDGDLVVVWSKHYYFITFFNEVSCIYTYKVNSLTLYHHAQQSSLSASQSLTVWSYHVPHRIIASVIFIARSIEYQQCEALQRIWIDTLFITCVYRWHWSSTYYYCQ